MNTHGWSVDLRLRVSHQVGMLNSLLGQLAFSLTCGLATWRPFFHAIFSGRIDTRLKHRRVHWLYVASRYRYRWMGYPWLGKSNITTELKQGCSCGWIFQLRSLWDSMCRFGVAFAITGTASAVAERLMTRTQLPAWLSTPMPAITLVKYMYSYVTYTHMPAYTYLSPRTQGKGAVVRVTAKQIFRMAPTKRIKVMRLSTLKWWSVIHLTNSHMGVS